MKKFTALFLTLSVLLMTFHGFVLPTSALTYETLTYTVENNEITITECDPETVGTVTVPEEIGGDPVVAIGSYAFYNCRQIEKIILPNSIRVIQGSAFSYCGMKEIEMPENNVSLGSCAFGACDQLQSINLPSDMTEIPDALLGGCKALEEIEIPANVTKIGSEAFRGCASLKEIHISDLVTQIGPSVFRNCSSLKTVTLPENMDGVFYITFYGCTALEEVTIPKGITALYGQIFGYCSNLKTLYLPNSLSYIDGLAFLQCDTAINVYYSGTLEEWKAMDVSEFTCIPDGSLVYCNGEPEYTALFEDVDYGTWFLPYVDYAVENGLFRGISNVYFSPEINITRGQFVQVLANMEKIDTTDKNVESGFSDVESGSWYAPAIKWASESGIVNGLGNGVFAPNEFITREQMCVMLTRYIDFKQIELPQTAEQTPFADDAELAIWAREAVYRCRDAGLINGVGDNRFDPQGVATRAQAATIFSRFHQAI